MIQKKLIQQRMDYLLYIKNLKESYFIESNDHFVELLVNPEEHFQFSKDFLDLTGKERALARFLLTLDYERLRWSLDFINDYGKGSIANDDFGYLGDKLQTSVEYVVNIVIPVLNYVGLVEREESSVSLTQKWYDMNMR